MPNPSAKTSDGPIGLAEVMRLLTPGALPESLLETLIDRVEGRR